MYAGYKLQVVGMLTVKREHLAHDSVWLDTAKQDTQTHLLISAWPCHAIKMNCDKVDGFDRYLLGGLFFLSDFIWECHTTLHSLVGLVPLIATVARAWGCWGWSKASGSLAHRLVWIGKTLFGPLGKYLKESEGPVIFLRILWASMVLWWHWIETLGPATFSSHLQRERQSINGFSVLGDDEAPWPLIQWLPC